MYMRQTIAFRVCLLNLIPATIAAITSCTPVKEYQKNKINDSEMSLSNRKVEKNELNFQSYREGSSGANGGKTGGGCGCN
jgi:uncharacterized protein DUF4266